MVRGKLYIVLVNLKKAFDHVQRELIWRELGKGVMKRKFFAITEMYKNIKISVVVNGKQLKN